MTDPESTRDDLDGGALAIGLRRALANRHVIWLAALLALFLCRDALDFGFQLDDYAHRAALVGVEGFEDFQRPFWRLFTFAEQGVDIEAARQMGSWPWWTSEDLNLSFLRPVSGFSHWVDHRLWPDNPWAMHAHSLLWMALVIIAVGSLYRQLEDTPWVAGLATLCFALDEAHAVPTAWIANRNALLAVCFGSLAMLAHHRWRLGWRWGAVGSCSALLVAVLSNEGAVAVGGYLVAYAVCIETGSWKSRLRSLVPGAAVGLVWTVAYKLLGFGTQGSGVYIDPGTDPGRFLHAMWERGPWLVVGQWTPIPADLPGLMNVETRRVGWMLAMACCVVLGVLLADLCRRDRRARFWAIGMVLSLVPICATFPSNRLLMFVGIGAMGLLARAWLDVRRRWRRRRRAEQWNARQWLRGACLAVALVFHLVLAPLLLQTVVGQQKAFFGNFDRAVASMPNDAALADQHLVMVNAPSSFIIGYGLLRRACEGDVLPLRMRLLTSSIYGVEVRRPDAMTLELRPRGGLLMTPGSGQRLGLPAPAFDVRYFFQMLDLLFRGTEPPFEVGDGVRLQDMDVEVLEVIDGRPAAIRYHFDRPLEDASLRWVSWRQTEFVAFEPPAVGERLTLPAMNPWLPRSP